MTNLTTRYPGTQSFESSQRNIFFGRDRDIEKLTKMIELEQMVLVYAKSGIGKTSLINAGVLPELEKKGNYTFHKIRFGAWKEGNSTSKEIAVKSFSGFKTEQNYLDKIIYQDNSLWYFSKKWQLQQDEDENTLLLILDQFEELFTYPDEVVNEFKKELAELLFTVVPQRFTDQKELLEDIKPGFIGKEDEKLLFEQPKVKILFAIRNDKMSELNNMSDYIPRILLKHYELAPLTNEQAMDAIIKPAQMDGNFASQKFTYHQAALDEIMQFLTKEGKQKDNVESFQLQILCKVVESKVIANEFKEILVAHVSPVRDIYQNFYDNLINSLALSEDQKLSVKRMIEDGLIEEATERRLQLADEQIKYKYNVSSKTLDLLINEHLLRLENREDFRLYELAHDTLVEPILESKKMRIENEKNEEARKKENIRITQEKERIERKRKQKRQRQIIIIASIAAFVSIAFGVFGFVNMQKAQNNLEKAIGFQVQGKMRDAISAKNNQIYNAAIYKYNELLEIYRRYPELEFDSMAVYNDIKECIKYDSLNSIFQDKLGMIDSLMSLAKFEDLIFAQGIFIELNKMNYFPGKRQLADKKSSFKLIVNNFVTAQLRILDMQINAGIREDALKTMKEIEWLDPGNLKIRSYKKKILQQK